MIVYWLVKPNMLLEENATILMNFLTLEILIKIVNAMKDFLVMIYKKNKNVKYVLLNAYHAKIIIINVFNVNLNIKTLQIVINVKEILEKAKIVNVFKGILNNLEDKIVNQYQLSKIV